MLAQIVALAAMQDALEMARHANDPKTIPEILTKVQESKGTHVVIALEEEGLRWLCETEDSCNVIKEILGEHAKVVTKEEFISRMQMVEEEE